VVLDPAIEGTHLKRWTLAGMVRSDLRDRAIPWTRLLMEEGASLPRGLNVGAAGRASVLASGGAAAAVALVPLAPAAAGAALAASAAALAGINARFLRRLLREGGAGVAAAGVPLLCTHYLCAGLGYAWARLTPGR
jgi:hypothetical protein